MTHLQGACVKHVIITPICRKHHGHFGAFDIAVERLREEYEKALNEFAPSPFLHLALTVHRLPVDPDSAFPLQFTPGELVVAVEGES